jgi:hypothetical protein
VIRRPGIASPPGKRLGSYQVRPMTCSPNYEGVTTFQAKHAMPLYRPLSPSNGAGRLIS